MRWNFLENKDGNIAIIFAIAAVPMISFMGVAIDYTRASAVRTAMQGALDATTLMVSRDAPTLSAAEISSRAQANFNALASNFPELRNIAVTAKYTFSPSSGSSVETTATGKIDTSFAKVVGYPTMDLNTKSTTTWGNTRTRIALALDSTGSMKDHGKMSAMQTAAKKLVDQLSANAQNPGDVYISLIPFAEFINTGSLITNKPWLDWSDWEETNGDCNVNSGDKSKTRCSQKGGSWTPDNHVLWNGCITDRDEDYDVKSTPPNMVNATSMFQPEQVACPVPIVSLTYDWISIKARIDQMSPVGATNQPVGMAWAWLSLLQQDPLNAPPQDGSYEYKRYMIVLSDGLNTKNKKAGNGSTPSSYVDGRQRLLCDNIKADGVTIYTLQVNTDNDPVSSVLQYCASSSDNFYMLTSADQIMAAFDKIGATMSKLRIAK
jgi:Flp pilus assembly protein TadG